MNDLAFLISKNNPNSLLFNIWITTIYSLLAMTIINFFIGSYSSIKALILENINIEYSMV